MTPIFDLQTTLKNKIHQCFNEYESPQKGYPSLHKLKKDLHDIIFETFVINHSVMSIHEILNTTQNTIEVYNKKIANKMQINSKDVINSIAVNALRLALDVQNSSQKNFNSLNCLCKEIKSQDSIGIINSLRNSLSEKEIEDIETLLAEQIFTQWEILETNYTQNPSAHAREFIYFSKKLANILSQISLNTTTCFIENFEEKVYNLVTCTFDASLLREISKSNEYEEATKAVTSSILEITTFIDCKNKKLQNFIRCFEKIYINLFNTKDSIKDPQKSDLVLKALFNILKGLTQKAIREFENSKSSQNIDLSDAQILNLKKRLDLLMVNISDLIGTQIEVKLEMKVKQDILIAILVQLHSFISNTNGLAMVKEWIEKNPNYDYANFQAWLLMKVKEQSPVAVMPNDCNATYFQFLNESMNTAIS